MKILVGYGSKGKFFHLKEFCDELEKQNIISVLNQPNFSGFHSIFTDYVSEAEWNKTKDQIKNRFRTELFDIDDTS